MGWDLPSLYGTWRAYYGPIFKVFAFRCEWALHFSTFGQDAGQGNAPTLLSFASEVENVASNASHLSNLLFPLSINILNFQNQLKAYIWWKI